MADDNLMAVDLAAPDPPVEGEGEYGARFEYLPGVFLSPRTQELPKYERAAAKVAFFSDYVSVGAIVFLLGMTFVDVVMRALFKMPFAGTYDWTRYLMVLIAAFGMPICTMNDEHVCVDVLVKRFPQKAQPALEWMNFALVVFYMYVLITQDWVQGVFNATTGQTSSGVPWPTYPFYYFISIGFACMLAIVVVKMVNLGRGVK